MAKIGITNVMECTSDPSSSSILELHELIFRDGIDFSRDPFPEIGPLGVRKHLPYDVHTLPEIKIMTFPLSPSVLWISTCMSFLSADSIISVSSRLNSTALLPCQFKRDLSQTPHVRWHIGSETVFERQGEKVYQDKGYKDRVDVPEDELLKGNCSLVLKNVRDTDGGIYKSYMWVTDKGYNKWDFVQNVELRIDETPMPDTETSEEHPTTNDAGINSPNTLIIISSVVPCVFMLLAIIAIIMFRVVRYRRRNINQPSNQIALRTNVDDEHQDFFGHTILESI